MKVNFHTFEEYQDYIQGNPVQVCEALYQSINVALRTNKEDALMFEIFFENQDYVYEVFLEKENWTNSLERCVEIFSEHNKSDLAIEAYELKQVVLDFLK
tara:strand:- start:1259 stop:1558 length:300 start_codon:yes stop_codon:yes gene_type:complete